MPINEKRNPIVRIKKEYESLRKSEKKVASYLLNYQGDYKELTTAKLSKNTGVSDPTIMRFSRAIGYTSFKELKLALIEEDIKNEMNNQRTCDRFYGYPLSPLDTMDNVPDTVVTAISGHLEHSVKSIDKEVLCKCVDIIAKSNRIIIVGVESSATIAYDLNVKLKYLGLDSTYNEDQYLKYLNVTNLDANDVVIGISYSGYTKETINVLKIARKTGAKTIAITNFTNSEISKHADEFIEISGEQFLYGNMVYSRATQLAVVDMLYMGIILTDYEYYTRRIDEICRLINDTI